MGSAILMYLKVMLVGGLICMLGQILVIRTKITTARILVLFLMIGAVLGGFGVYGYLVEWAGCGATVPITGFGNALARGAINGAATDGIFGAVAGGLIATSAGVSASIVFGYLVALFTSSKTKKH